MSNPRTVTTREVAARLGVSPRTVARWVEAGTLTPLAQAPGPRGAFLFDADRVERIAGHPDDQPAAAEGAAR